MSQITTLQQAGRNALATWLDAKLASAGVVVEARWMEGDRQLPPKACSIIDAGPRQIEWLQTEIALTAPVDGDATKIDVTWNFGFIEQAIQLDVWAPTDLELDDLIARVDQAVNQGARGLGIANVDSFAAGLQLPLGDGWAPGVVSFEFENASTSVNPSSVGESEWRATYRGVLNAQMVQTARTAKLARVLLKSRINDVEPPDVTTITLPTDT